MGTIVGCYFGTKSVKMIYRKLFLYGNRHRVLQNLKTYQKSEKRRLALMVWKIRRVTAR